MADPTTLTVLAAAQAGTAITESAADQANGNRFVITGKEVVHVNNGDAADHTITIASQVNCNQNHDHDLAVVVAAGAHKVIGPLPKARFADAAGYCQISWSAGTDTDTKVYVVRNPDGDPDTA